MFIVYLRTCKVSNKSYVGYTKASLERRWSNGRGYGSVMGAAIKKYGVDAWEHSILSRHKTETAALRWEEIWIRRKNTVAPNGYNVLPNGSTNPVRTEIGLAKMRAARKGQYTEAQRAANRAKRGKGTPWLLGELNPMKKEEVREKVRRHLLGRSCPWLAGNNHHMRKNTELAKQHGEKIRGRLLVNDGATARMLPREEAEVLLANGWVRGRLPKREI